MNIVIVGGGFAGVKSALELSKRHVGRITLISDESYFLHHATMYSTATGRSEEESVIPLEKIFLNHPNVKVVKDTMKSIDPERRLIVGKSADYRYDKAIIAIGSVTSYFGIKGVAKHSFGIKSLDEVREFQDHIHDELLQQRLDNEYFVVGAGPTGIELAAALHEYLEDLIKLHRLRISRPKVTIVEAEDRILPKMSKGAAKVVGDRLKKIGVKVLVNNRVESLDDDSIKINGKTKKTKTAIWTSGVTNHPFFEKHDHIFRLDNHGRVIVNGYLEALPNVFVLGDNNSVRYSGMAWPAMDQAKYVAGHISRIITKSYKPEFKPKMPPTGLPVGEGWGYVQWGPISFSGWRGAFVRRWMELYGYAQIAPLSVAIKLWRARELDEIRR